MKKSFLRGEDKSTSKPINSEDINLTRLNASQKTAVASFASLDNGLQVLQGPTGTDKTTTIVQLISLWALKQERVLVCAPSNKAVQVLATRFLADFPDIKMVFAGRHEKLVDELRPIFIDNHKDQLSAMANIMQEIINQRQLIIVNQATMQPSFTTNLAPTDRAGVIVDCLGLLVDSSGIYDYVLYINAGTSLKLWPFNLTTNKWEDEPGAYIGGISIGAANKATFLKRGKIAFSLHEDYICILIPEEQSMAVVNLSKRRSTSIKLNGRPYQIACSRQDANKMYVCQAVSDLWGKQS